MYLLVAKWTKATLLLREDRGFKSPQASGLGPHNMRGQQVQILCRCPFWTRDALDIQILFSETTSACLERINSVVCVATIQENTQDDRSWSNI